MANLIIPYILIFFNKYAIISGMEGGGEVEHLTSIFVSLGFNGLDMVTGILSALRLRNLESKKLRDGLFKKVGFLFCYALAWIVDSYGKHVGFDLGFHVLPLIVGYVCLTEIVSIIENIAVINEDILPEKLLNFFKIKL